MGDGDSDRDRIRVFGFSAAGSATEGSAACSAVVAVGSSTCWAGADAVVAADPRTDLLNPNAIRASLGTIFSVPLACAASGDTLTWCRSQRLRIVAARVDAATSYANIDLSGPIAFVLGSEASGLSTIWDVPAATSARPLSRLSVRSARARLRCSLLAGSGFSSMPEPRGRGGADVPCGHPRARPGWR